MIDFSELYVPPMQEAWIGALITAIGALAGAAINMFSTKKTNDAQREMMQEQNEFNKEMQTEQNEYNSPAHQKQLMEEAGLNPAFLFGASAPDSTQGSPVTAADAPKLQSPQLDVNSIAQSLFAAKKLKNETLKNEVDVQKTIQETESYKIAVKQADERFENEMAKIKADTHLSEQDRTLRVQQVETEKARQKEIIFNTENLRYNLDLLQQKAVTEKWSQKKLQSEIDRIAKLTPVEASEIASRANLNHEQAKVASETINKVQEEVRNLVKSGNQIDAITISQIIDNQVKDIEANNKVDAAILRSDNPVINLIYEHCNGMLGDIAKAAGAFIAAPYSSKSRYNNFERRTNQRSKDNSSWLFNN